MPRGAAGEPEVNNVQNLLARRIPGYALERAFYTDPEIFPTELIRRESRPSELPQ